MPKGSDQFTSQQVVCLILITIFLVTIFWTILFPMLFSEDSIHAMNERYKRQQRKESREREHKILKKLKRSM